jgi:hypothetical protein
VKPTPADLLKLRRLLGKADGWAELRRWGKLAKKLPKGKRKANPLDEMLLLSLEWICRTAAKERGMSRTAALRWYVESDKNAVLGVSHNAAVHRLYQKLQDRNFTDEELFAPVRKMGLDPTSATCKKPSGEALDPSDGPQIYFSHVTK